LRWSGRRRLADIFDGRRYCGDRPSENIAQKTFDTALMILPVAAAIIAMVASATNSRGGFLGGHSGDCRQWQIFLMVAGATVRSPFGNIALMVMAAIAVTFLMVLQGYLGTSNKIEATMKTTTIYFLLI